MRRPHVVVVVVSCSEDFVGAEISVRVAIIKIIDVMVNLFFILIILIFFSFLLCLGLVLSQEALLIA
ncbi:MAG TPA: hypothetical protein VJ810_06030 [Blastocatellia bacterium]|nr:hypothetical protein [Blastocatellia bacterium]